MHEDVRLQGWAEGCEGQGKCCNNQNTSRSIDQNNGVFIFAVELGLTFPDLRYVQTERLNAIQELQTMLSD